MPGGKVLVEGCAKFAVLDGAISSIPTDDGLIRLDKRTQSSFDRTLETTKHFADALRPGRRFKAHFSCGDFSG
jgi:hypothetical protein